MFPKTLITWFPSVRSDLIPIDTGLPVWLGPTSLSQYVTTKEKLLEMDRPEE